MKYPILPSTCVYFFLFRYPTGRSQWSGTPLLPSHWDSKSWDSAIGFWAYNLIFYLYRAIATNIIKFLRPDSEIENLRENTIEGGSKFCHTATPLFQYNPRLRDEGKILQEIREKILQKPPPIRGKKKEVSAGFDAVFGFWVMQYFQWSFWSHFEKYCTKYCTNTAQKPLRLWA